jgi:hypothetical protein
MSLEQLLIIISVNAAFSGTCIIFVVIAFSKIHQDLSALNCRLDVHSRRIDQLYGMFVDLLKERKNG